MEGVCYRRRSGYLTGSLSLQKELAERDSSKKFRLISVLKNSKKKKGGSRIYLCWRRSGNPFWGEAEEPSEFWRGSSCPTKVVV